MAVDSCAATSAAELKRFHAFGASNDQSLILAGAAFRSCAECSRWSDIEKRVAIASWIPRVGLLVHPGLQIGDAMGQDENELFQTLELVHDEESFLQFLLALRDDREASIAQEEVTPSSPYGPDAGGWENTTIERFLDTAVRYARDSVNGNPFYTKPDNPWRRCADILFGAKGYE